VPWPQSLIYRFPKVTYTYLKYLWSANHRREAFQRLLTFTETLSEHEVRMTRHSDFLFS